ncbi:hypothetical protein OSTOST_20101, partial [Ostertagia ostertagi]
MAGENQGVAVFFYQFLASQGDCVTVCDVDAICQGLCGDAMDHVKMKKALVVNSTATITMQSISQPDGYYHSGILSGKRVFSILTKESTSSVIRLFNLRTNYPYTPFDYSYCNVTFKSEDAIRLAIYDLVTKEGVIFEGLNLSGEATRISLSGRHVTDDEPVALYFAESVTVSFSFLNTTTFYTRGFYILVDSYTREY